MCCLCFGFIHLFFVISLTCLEAIGSHFIIKTRILMTNWSFFGMAAWEVAHILIEAYAEPCHKINSPGQHSIQTSTIATDLCLTVALI